MRKTYLFIVLLSSLCSLFAQQKEAEVPIEIRKILDQDYSGWRFPPLYEDWIVSSFKDGTLKPFFISGDFDGNGKKDFGMQFIHPADSSSGMQRVIVAFLKQGKSFHKIVLETGPFTEGGVDIILDLVKKGSTGEDLEHGKTFIYERDGISVGYSDKASHDYIWRNGRFEAVTTGD